MLLPTLTPVSCFCEIFTTDGIQQAVTEAAYAGLINALFQTSRNMLNQCFFICVPLPQTDK